MSTHIVEIRPATARGGGDWYPLTKLPIQKSAADALVRMIGSAWEARIVVDPEISPGARQFADFEAAVPQLKRWQPIELAHHPSCARHVATWTTHNLGSDPSDRLTGEEWLAGRAIDKAAQQLAERGLDIRPKVPRVHVGRCTECRAHAVAISISVAVQTEDGTWSREYRMGPSS